MARRKRKRREPSPWWAWMLLGLSMGLAVALFVYLSAGDSPLDFDATPRVATTAPADPVATEAPVPEAAPAEPSRIEQAVADNDADVDDLAFYRALADAEVELPDTLATSIDRDEQGTTFEIQAGSFRSFEDADERRASLALLGIESRIQPAMIGGDRWHRILIGPLERGRVNSVSRVLRDQRIDFMQPRQITD